MAKNIQTRFKDGSKIFFTSDTHFGHENIIKFCNRPFSSLEEMDNTLIDNWNKTVPEDGIVFHLGDFAWGNCKAWEEYRSKLNGKIILIRGNHDFKNGPQTDFEAQKLFDYVAQQMHIEIEGRSIYLNHFPYLCYGGMYRPLDRVVYQLFGHVHSCEANTTGQDNARLQYLMPSQYDVGVDGNGFKPVSWNMVNIIIKEQIVKANGGKLEKKDEIDGVLVIPDVHGRNFWKPAVEKYAAKVRKIIFTGDYHDPYEKEGISRKTSIENFEHILSFYEANKDKTVLLLGNHDYHYIFDVGSTWSRFDKANLSRLREMFGEYKDVFNLAHEEIIGDKTYLFTHAGLMQDWSKKYEDIIGGEPTVDNLNALLPDNKGEEALMAMSSYRMMFSTDKTGSIIWSDVRERFRKDYTKDTEKYQVFGHTLLEKPIVMEDWACLDCKKAFIIDSEGIKEI